MKGQRRCRLHGGASPQAKRKAKERIARERIGALLVRMERETEDPLEGLMVEVTRSAIAVEVLGGMVAQLDDPALPEDSQDSKDSKESLDTIYGPNHLGDGAPHVLVRMWNEERDRHARFCKLAIEAGVSERMTRVAEAQGHQIARLIAAIIDDRTLGLNAKQRSKARRVAASHLRALPGGA